jgi:hypothetical protein
VDSSINNGDDDDSSNSSSTMNRVDDNDNDVIDQAIQEALADESNTQLSIHLGYITYPPTAAQRIMGCLRENPTRFTSLSLWNCHGLDNPTVLNIICRGLLDCPSITGVSLIRSNLTSEGLDLLRPALYNTSITYLSLQYNYNTNNYIQGQSGGEAIHDLVVGNNTLVELSLRGISFDGAFAIALGHCLHLLQKLVLGGCGIGNADMTSLLLPADGMNNTALLHLDISYNHIQGAKGGRQVALVL